jgi:hypothetical protein
VGADTTIASAAAVAIVAKDPEIFGKSISDDPAVQPPCLYLPPVSGAVIIDMINRQKNQLRFIAAGAGRAVVPEYRFAIFCSSSLLGGI